VVNFIMKINFATNFTSMKKTLKLHMAGLLIELFFIQRSGGEEMLFELKEMVTVFRFKDLVGVVAREMFGVE
jgi:hypothetical protein